MSLIYTRVNDQKIKDRIDMLPDAEHTLDKYIHLGETQELSEANAAAFNPKSSTASVHALRYKGQGKSSGTRKVHMVTDDGEIQGTVDLNTAVERLIDVISCKFVDTIDVFMDEDTTSHPKGNLDVHTVHKPKRYQAFARVCIPLTQVERQQVSLER